MMHNIDNSLGIAIQVNQLQALHNNTSKGRRSDDREFYAVICAITCRLAENEDDWFDFCRLPAWESKKTHRPKSRDRKNPIAAVLKIVHGFETRQQLQWVSFRARALGQFIEQKTPPEKIPSEIKRRGGILKMARLQVQASKPETAPGRIRPIIRVKNAIPKLMLAKVLSGLTETSEDFCGCILTKITKSSDGFILMELSEIYA